MTYEKASVSFTQALWKNNDLIYIFSIKQTCQYYNAYEEIQLLFNC